MTDLFDNPFGVLGATPRTSRNALIELAEDAALSQDASRIAEARSILSTPKSRLAAELSWFPGVSPAKASTLFQRVRDEPDVVIFADLGVSTLAALNTYAAAIARASPVSDTISMGIFHLTERFAELDVPAIRREVNEDREVAGYPLVGEDKAVSEALSSLRRHYVGQMLRALDSLPTTQLVEVVTEAVDTYTESGEEHPPELIADLAEAYELRASAYLDAESEGISEVIRATIEAADSGAVAGDIQKLVSRIEARVRKWDSVAQPIQLANQAKGLKHEASMALAMDVRSLAIHLFNKHDHLDTAKSISTMLHEVFAEVPDVVERVGADIEALEDIELERETAEEKEREDAEEFAREITYATSIGTFFKDKFSMSPSGIVWRGSTFPLASVRSICWGGVRSNYSVTYYINLQTTSGALAIELSDEAQYDAITQRLWRAVGIRLLIEFIEGLKKGQQYKAGNLILRDDGVVLRIPRMFKDDELVVQPWMGAKKSVQNGAVNLFAEKGPATGSFELRDTPNAPIYEFALRMLWEKGGSRLSSIVGGGS